MAIRETVNGNRPYITGGILKGQYVAEGVHFHWGSPSSSGAEHMINGKHYSGEMHIVHRNKKYNSIDEAVQYSDGIAVLGVFLKITHVRYYFWIYFQAFIMYYFTAARSYIPGSKKALGISSPENYKISRRDGDTRLP